jgi:hypothetical protein
MFREMRPQGVSCTRSSVSLLPVTCKKNSRATPCSNNALPRWRGPGMNLSQLGFSNIYRNVGRQIPRVEAP